MKLQTLDEFITAARSHSFPKNAYVRNVRGCRCLSRTC